ncbi:MAG: Sec61p translocation complex subunit [Alectoria sarmentosa]|nr:MAG: Sec61p translocation complex subunit [Alectoria sarmentosa]
MSDQFREILDIPRDFLHDGTQFINRCTKPDKREILKLSQAVGVGFVVMGALGYVVKLSIYGVATIVMLGIMTVDLPRLMVWNRTGDEKRRKRAGKVLKVRNRPDWLTVSLALVSVAMLEALPLFWSHLFISSSTASYASVNLLILFSQVVPTFITPIYHLEISAWFTGFARFVMWLSAPATVLPAYVLQRLRQWKRRGQQAHMDGLLPLDELKEFIYLHEKGQGYGGTLDDHVGKAMRTFLELQISEEASSTHVETEESSFIQFTEGVGLRSVQSLHQEGLTFVENESTSGPTSTRSHRQEGSTAIEDVFVPGLRKRGERSTEGYEPVGSMISMQIPEQALLKDPIHGSPTPISNRYVERGASNGRPLQRDFPLENISNSVTHRKHRLPLVESFWNDRKDRGFVTDSFLLEQG